MSCCSDVDLFSELGIGEGVGSSDIEVLSFVALEHPKSVVAVIAIKTSFWIIRDK